MESFVRVKTHRFDVSVRNAAAVEVLDAFDRAYKLDSGKV